MTRPISDLTDAELSMLAEQMPTSLYVEERQRRAAEADGWIAWGGGECPVPGDAEVEVTLRGKSIRKRRAVDFFWDHAYGDWDIVVYRLVTPAPAPAPDPRDEEIRRLRVAGKHLAVKLAECYRTVGRKPQECQALREWIRALASAPAAPERDGEVATDAARYRHVKRGSTYELLGIGRMQAENWEEREYCPADDPVAGCTVDMREVAIYRSDDDGSLWVRPREEFEDGRFAALAKIGGAA